MPLAQSMVKTSPLHFTVKVFSDISGIPLSSSFPRTTPLSSGITGIPDSSFLPRTTPLSFSISSASGIYVVIEDQS